MTPITVVSIILIAVPAIAFVGLALAIPPTTATTATTLEQESNDHD